jgi:hypothetical protein
MSRRQRKKLVAQTLKSNRLEPQLYTDLMPRTAAVYIKLTLPETICHACGYYIRATCVTSER